MVNGEREDKTSLGPVKQSEDPMYIGAAPEGAGTLPNFVGDIGRMMMYDKALSERELQVLSEEVFYNAPSDETEDGE